MSARTLRRLRRLIKLNDNFAPPESTDLPDKTLRELSFQYRMSRYVLRLRFPRVTLLDDPR